MSHITDVMILCDADDIGALEHEIAEDCGYRDLTIIGRHGIMFEVNHLGDAALARSVARVCPRGARVITRDEYGDGWKVMEWQLALDSDFDETSLYDNDYYRHEHEHCSMLAQLRKVTAGAKALREKNPTAQEDTLMVMAESLGTDEKKFMREAVSIVARDPALRSRFEGSTGDREQRSIKVRFPGLGW